MIIFCYTSTHDVLCYFNEWVINELQKYKKIILYKGCKKNIYKKGGFIFTFPRKLDMNCTPKVRHKTFGGM